MLMPRRSQMVSRRSSMRRSASRTCSPECWASSMLVQPSTDSAMPVTKSSSPLAVNQVDGANVEAPVLLHQRQRVQLLAPRRHCQALVAQFGQHLALRRQRLGAEFGLEDEVHMM